LRSLAHIHQLRINVTTIRNILVALICLSPITLLWDGFIVQALLTGLVAVALALTALALRPGETAFLVSVVRPLIIAAGVPVLWMILQILPLHVLAQPMWKSAEGALQHPLAPSMSIDPGAGIIALGQYITMLALAFVSAALAVDRQRAEWVLFALCAATTLIAGLLLAHNGLFAGAWLGRIAQQQAVDCAALGIIIAAAGCIRSIERYETRHTSRSLQILGIFAAAIAICAAALVLSGGKHLIFGAVVGLVALVCIVIIRRFALGQFAIGGLAILFIGLAVILVAVQPTKSGSSVAVAFAADSPESGLSQRMLNDAPLVGIGAGTFAALAPIYRELDEPPSRSAATTASALAIELGTPMLWLIAAATVAGIITLLRASLLRGRDSFYAAMAGSCLITMLLSAFINAGLLGTGPSFITAAAIGLGVGQSKSRTAQA
jgi:hypothetical protein